MLKNNLPINPEDEPPPDWSFWAIRIEQLSRQREDAMNECRRKDARALWFQIQVLELELGKAIDRIP